MENPFFSAKDSKEYSVDVQRPVDDEAVALAAEFTSQVDAYYSLPRPNYNRREIIFSPSGVSKCARELYYQNTNAPMDTMPQVPWRERMARNGTGSHDVTEADYRRMEEKLRKAGLPVRFRLIDAEVSGDRTYKVNGYSVRLRGRCDGQFGLLDDEGNMVETIGFEKKTKDKRKNLNKIMKDGQPQEDHRAQAVAYSLIWGIQRWMFEYESLQKPDWKDVNPEKPDIAHFLITVDREEAKALLVRLSKIVEAIQNKQLPPAELDKCGFCPFKTVCQKDGGYVG